MLERYNYEPTIFHMHTIGKGKLDEMEHWEQQQKSTFLHDRRCHTKWRWWC